MTALMNDVLTVRDVACELGVTTATVRRWLVTGELDGVRLGGSCKARYRVTRHALEAFVRPVAPTTTDEEETL
jgi:excisionase family DNA binding protein